MSKLTWDAVGERFYETGVDCGALYVMGESGYGKGVAWNGLVNVNEQPTGAEPNPQYADNIKYLNLLSTEEFKATLEAFTYPTEFEACDGSAALSTGVLIGQQSRKTFGLAYRTKIGNDLDDSVGYKLHLIYGAMAAPTDKSYQTINDSPEAITFSWELSTTPVSVTGFKPTASLVVDSTKVSPSNLAALEAVVFGSVSGDASLPMPDEVLAIFSVEYIIPEAPAFNAATGVVNIPDQEGVVYKKGLATLESGEQDPLTPNTPTTITASAGAGATLDPLATAEWTFEYVTTG